MRLINQVKHYAGALIRGITSGRLFEVASTYFSHSMMERAVVNRFGLTVRGGPFKGMQYIKIPPRHSLVAKLFGNFEQEVHPFIDSAIASEPTTIINIGSAEGYYSVGFAFRLPNAEVHAYDIDPRARDLCTALSAANGVTNRVHVHGLCDTQELNLRLNSGAGVRRCL